MDKVHLVVNAAAGAGGAASQLGRVRARLAAAADVVELDTGSPTEVRDAVGRAVAEGAERIVVAGGDGLVHHAVQPVAGRSGIVVGIVPLGTGNDIARALGLPLDDPLEAASRALAEPVAIDGVRTPTGWAVSVATAGFSGRVNERANRLRWPRGATRYQAATLLLLPRLRADHLVVTVDGVEHRLPATLVAVGNTRYFGGAMAICPDADPTDGLLDVAVVGAVGRLRLLRFFPTVYGGRHRTNPAVTFLRGRVVTLDGASGAGATVWADGEPVAPMPLTCEAVPGALRIAGARPAR